MKKAAIYIRVSTSMQVDDGLSLATQKSTLTNYCQQRRWIIYKVYEDGGYSAKNSNRPALQQLFDDAESREFDFVLVWKLSRFSRSLKCLMNDCDFLEERDIRLISYSEGFDTSTPIGRLLRNVLGVVNEFEREVLIENLKEVYKFKARRGDRTAVKILGYDIAKGKNHLILNKKEAELVKLIYQTYLETSSLTKTTDIINSMGFRGKRGKPFQVSGIRTILMNATYCGFNIYHRKRYPGNHTPIIAIEQFNAVQRLLSKMSRSRLVYPYEEIQEEPEWDSDSSPNNYNHQKMI
ncbi:recombinase family protein [Listeria ilorinensis]|uniref:recombinase family protein n=1 Tax=Listeria ilorinensis TaxID=2867439 RepID=UPI001EF485A8|nr:recombinase family protein [Listeria ilorinensis]